MDLRKWGISLAMAACLAGAGLSAAAAFGSEGATDADRALDASAGQTAAAEGRAYADNNANTSYYEQYAPEVRVLEDGTKVQRTPSEGAVFTSLDSSYTYHTPTDGIPYNTYYLKADSRGCNACHEDLAQTLNDGIYPHADLNNPYGIQITVQMCQDCHTFGYGYITNQNSFGTLIHGIHATGQADCWNCHVATGDGSGMQLWDVAKFEELRGITPVADVQGEFSYDQDLTTPATDVFDFGWDYFDLDYLRTAKVEQDAPLDQQLFDQWPITVTGVDGTSRTWTLPELIEQFPSETFAATFHCTLNPTGGPYIANATYTGIPLNAIFEEMGIDPASDDFGAVTIVAPDGFTESVQGDHYTRAYLCYQIDDEPLPWSQGYPVQMIVPGSAAPASVKQVSDVQVVSPEDAEAIHEWNGWPCETEGTAYYTPGNWPMNDENGYQNKPNVGLFDFVNGQVVETGEPYEFTGYATAYDQRIVALEFSMDGGATWTRCDTPDTTADNWVIWHFAYTPEADSAYVLQVRSVSEDGLVTKDPIEVMFNAQTGAYQE